MPKYDSFVFAINGSNVIVDFFMFRWNNRKVSTSTLADFRKKHPQCGFVAYRGCDLPTRFVSWLNEPYEARFFHNVRAAYPSSLEE